MMPSAMGFSHSWLRVYLSSAGILVIDITPAAATPACSWGQLDQGATEAHERRPHRQRRQQPVAHLDLHLGAGRRRHACQSDGARQRRRIGTTGHLALPDARHNDTLVAAQYAALLQHQSDALVAAAERPDALQRRAADA